MAASNVITNLSIAVALLAAASAVLGFIAQATKLNPNEIQFHESSGMCVYPAKPAHALGICALPLLVAAMVISTVCFACVKPQDGISWSRRVKGVICCVASWIAAAVAVANYIQGIRWNAATTRHTVAKGLYGYGCQYLKGKGFATAAVLTIIAAALGIRSFAVFLTAAPAPAAPPAAGGPEPKHDGQQSASVAPPPEAQGQAHAHV